MSPQCGHRSTEMILHMHAGCKQARDPANTFLLTHFTVNIQSCIRNVVAGPCIWFELERRKVKVIDVIGPGKLNIVPHHRTAVVVLRSARSYTSRCRSDAVISFTLSVYRLRRCKLNVKLSCDWSCKVQYCPKLI